MIRELGLSEEQQEKVREIFDGQRAQRDALFEKMSANREELHRLLESGTSDANAVGELVLEGRRLHDESRALRDAEQKAIRAILTPDQQKKFDKFKGQRVGPGRGPAGGPGGRPPGPEGWPAPPPGVNPGSNGRRPGISPSGSSPTLW